MKKTPLIVTTALMHEGKIMVIFLKPGATGRMKFNGFYQAACRNPIKSHGNFTPGFAKCGSAGFL